MWGAKGAGDAGQQSERLTSALIRLCGEVEFLRAEIEMLRAAINEQISLNGDDTAKECDIPQEL